MSCKYIIYFTVTLSGTSADEYFRGFFIQGRRMADNNAVGEFKITNITDQKAVCMDNVSI